MNSRRNALKVLGAAALTGGLNYRLDAAEKSLEKNIKGKINHSVCKWCYPDTSLEDLCKAASDIGLSSIELLGVKDFEVVLKHGLKVAMVSASAPGFGITNGWNKKEHHEKLIQYYKEAIDNTAKAGFENVIVFSGNREVNLVDEQGMEVCAEGLKKIMNYAEQKRINLVMELLNSKVNHPDYMCDHTNWGVALCDKIGSDRFKLLYDIYHMQIMEGDVIATINKNHKYFAHYHTGGVPGRHEIDNTQELNYPAIMEAIVKTGFKGFVAQEFIPERADKLASLKQGVQICDI